MPVRPSTSSSSWSWYPSHIAHGNPTIQAGNRSPRCCQTQRARASDEDDCTGLGGHGQPQVAVLSTQVDRSLWDASDTAVVASPGFSKSAALGAGHRVGRPGDRPTTAGSGDHLAGHDLVGLLSLDPPSILAVVSS